MKQVCVLGNGQLGRMLRQAGEPLGIAVWPVGLDAEPEAVPFHQSVITAVCGLLCCIGTLGLFLAPQFAVLWLTLAGFGGGGSFILAIAFISLRTRTHQQATSLSAMVNGGGYLIASFGPLFFGMLHDIVHTWQFLLIGLTLAGAAQAVAGWLAGRGKTV